ncbi:EAL domain-containing protein [Rhodobacter capsulatus]|uniref:EAL domain-containing protein n=1 Tax=Rhodobacter capsulatus TaxID=1061 RepID=UPI0003D35D6C|nr:EAL domain-containing protein [Rhodobacter capsulatus]ETD86934.1 histidine kinase [Rhodobacter capsulatus YW2]
MSLTATPLIALLAACPGAAFVVSRPGRILAANAEADRVFGTARPAVAGTGLSGLRLAEVIPCALGHRIMAALRRDGVREATRFRLALDRVEGSPHVVETLVWPATAETTDTPADTAAPCGSAGPLWIVLVLDVGAQAAATGGGRILCTGLAALRATEEARRKARESAEILRISTENSDLAPWVHHPGHGSGELSPHLATMLGRPANPPLDLAALAALIHPEDSLRMRRAFVALRRGRSDRFSQDMRLRRADGQWAWFTARGYRMPQTTPCQPVTLCGSLTDISARKADEALVARTLAEALHARSRAQQREEMLRTSGLCAGIGHFCASPLQGEAWTPDETYRLFGFEPGEFAATDAGWRSLIHPEDLPAAIAAMEDLKAGRTMLYDHVHRRQHKDGSYHWYRAVARRVERSDLGLPPLVAGALICVDQAKETEIRLADAADAARLARERLDTLADNAPGALFECRMAASGQMMLPYFSARLPDLAGVSGSEILCDACVVFRHVPPQQMTRLLRRAMTALRSGAAIEMRLSVRHPLRGLRWVSVAAAPFRREDASVCWFGQILDVTENVETEARAALAAEAALKAHARLASIAAVAPAGLYEIERFPEGAATIPYASPHFRNLLGLDHRDTIRLGEGGGGAQEVKLDDLPAFLTRDAASPVPPGGVARRFCIQHPLRGAVWLSNSATAKPQPDGTVVWTGALHDVTGDVRREAELHAAYRLAEDRRQENEWQALHDGLTGLPNRRYYDQVLANRIEQAKAGGKSGCTLIRIDLDHFKHVNDTLGHDAGDLVLCRVAEVLRASLRQGDFAARLGGDEFSVILARGLGREDAGALIGRVQDRLVEPLMFAGRQCRFGASFGIAEAEDLASTGPEIQFFADAALYRAKETGRNRMEFFTPELHQNLRRDRELAAEIQEGLDRDEFEPFFQAQVSARDHRLTGVETLLRWRHPERGLLAPHAFMHVAEQLRLVPEIDRVVMERSRESLAFWRERGLIVPKISFNVSSGRMHDPDVVKAAQTIARGETRVTFELLESILVEDESDLFRFHLDAIREAGIDIEIDDFGSGHASIIGLMQIGPSALKIDRRIVEPLGRDPQARHLVRAIIEIAETLGTATVAEGVETEAQAEILRDLGCDVLQGFLFSVPLSAADFVAFWQRHRKRLPA